MKVLSSDLFNYWQSSHKMVTVTIVPSLKGKQESEWTDITVTLTATGYTQVNNSITVPVGTKLSCSVTKQGYLSWASTFAVTGQHSIPVELTDEAAGTLTITKMPSDADLVLVATGFAQVGNTITVPLGTAVTYRISHPNMQADAGTIVVNSAQQAETLYCNCKVTLSAWDSQTSELLPDAITSVFDNTTGVTQVSPAIVKYGSTITYSVAKSGYDTVNMNTPIQIVQDTAIPVQMNPSKITISIQPMIHVNGTDTEVQNAIVTIYSSDTDAGTIVGQGTQSITVTKGSDIYYTIECQGYDTVMNIDGTPKMIPNVTETQVYPVSLNVTPLGILYLTQDSTWQVPLAGDYRMAVITNGGDGGTMRSAMGGPGGGASGNCYIVDMIGLAQGDTIGVVYGGSAVQVTKNGQSYGNYPHGTKGTDSVGTLGEDYNGFAGGSATDGDGGGGGGAGAEDYYSVVKTYSNGRWITSSITSLHGTVGNGGDGGKQGNSGGYGNNGVRTSGGSQTYGGSGGTGYNASTYGGGVTGGAYPLAQADRETPGVKGKGGTGAVNQQSLIVSAIQGGTITTSLLRSIISGGSGTSGGVWGRIINTPGGTSYYYATPGSAGGGGSWTNGSDGSDGFVSHASSISDITYNPIPGGQGGHGVVIIWRPSDYTGS